MSSTSMMESVLREVADSGIRRVWIQRGAESDDAVAFCRERGIDAVTGQCILMFAEPAASASWENVLGYRSWCTFTPASTLFCFLIAGGSCTLRASLVKRRAIFGKPVFRAAPIIVLSLVSLLGVASTVWYVSVDSAWSDGTTGATIEE